MREAIARAELGDDVYGEDPTINRLEGLAASMMGKEAAMLVPSGTRGNLVAMLTHCARGTKALLGSQAHTYVYEAGGAAALGGVVMTPIQNHPGGELDLDQLADELERPPDAHFAPPALCRSKIRIIFALARRSTCPMPRRLLNWPAAIQYPCISTAHGFSMRRWRWKRRPRRLHYLLTQFHSAYRKGSPVR
jgi:hypothetical protein